jgi:hypothetical protein
MNYLGLTVFAGNTPGLILDFDSATKEYTVEFEDGRVVKSATVYWETNIPADTEVALYRKASIGSGEKLTYDPQDGWDIVSNDESEADDECDYCGGQGVDDDGSLCSHCDGRGHMNMQHSLQVAAAQMQVTDQPTDLNEWVDELHDESDGEYTPDGEYGPNAPSSTMGDPDLGAHKSIDNKIKKLEDKIDHLTEMLEGKDLKGEDGEEISPEGIQLVDHDAVEDNYYERQTKPNPNLDEQYPSGTHSERYPGTLNPTAKVAKDCNCWDGYKRVPGTKPCAPGSCEKCDSARKEAAAKKKKQSPDEAVKKVNTVPPQGVRAAAKRGLKYYEEGKAGDGFEAATADRARRIAAGEALTEEHINRMHSFFERHAGGRSKKAKPGEVTAWDVAWLCWGGDAGRSWASKVDSQLHKARHPNSKGKHSYVDNTEVSYAPTPGTFDGQRITPLEQWDRSTTDEENGEANYIADGVEKGLGASPIELDRSGNPLMRTEEAEDYPQKEDVPFPDAPTDIVKAMTEHRDKKENMNPNKDVWDQVVHSHVREEAAWEDARVASPECSACGDPLVNGDCHSCGERMSKKEIKQASRQQKIAARDQKVIDSLKPRAAELGRLFGEAFAGRTATTEDSSAEGIFVPVPIRGENSNPYDAGGTGGNNATRGDAPELLKDILGEGNAMTQDSNKGNNSDKDGDRPLSDLFSDGMGVVIEFADSDESAKGNKMVEELSNALEGVLGEVFAENKNDAKEKKESSMQQQMMLKADDYVEAVIDGVKALVPRTMLNQLRGITGPTAPAQQQQQRQQPSSGNPTTPSMGYVNNGIPGAFGSVKQSIMDDDGIETEEDITDVDGNKLVPGDEYNLYATVDDEPELVTVESVTPTSVVLNRDDSKFEPQTITIEDFNANNLRFDPVVKDDALDGTPETMDDAGPGQDDIPGERNMSTDNPGGPKIAGRSYYPHQQKEFINESGRARNLDKLDLEGTHYTNGETTASDNIDDDFLFGV